MLSPWAESDTYDSLGCSSIVSNLFYLNLLDSVSLDAAYTIFSRSFFTFSRRTGDKAGTSSKLSIDFFLVLTNYPFFTPSLIISPIFLLSVSICSYMPYSSFLTASVFLNYNIWSEVFFVD